MPGKHLVTILHMKRLLVVIGLVVLSCFPSFGQIYRAQEYHTEENSLANFPRWEAALSASASTLSMQDFNGKTVSSGEWSAGAQMLYSVTRWFSFGPEGKVLFPGQSSGAFKFHQGFRLGAAAKFTLTPRSSTRVYMLLGAGQVSREILYVQKFKRSSDSLYLSAGMGLETDLNDWWFIGAEVLAVYEKDPQISSFFYASHHWSAGVQLRSGVRF